MPGSLPAAAARAGEVEVHTSLKYSHNALGTSKGPLLLLPGRGERARAVTTVFGSLDLGSAIGLLICGPLIRNLGWPSVFYLFAALGLVWSLAWPLLKPEQPDASLAAPASPPSNVAGRMHLSPLLNAEQIEGAICCSSLNVRS